MSELAVVIREAILTVLPTVPEEPLDLIVGKLLSQGVETTEDLIHVREEDILEFLQPIQCRKLLTAWKQGDCHGS
ncbi:hypothetical protein AAFF_G00342880 [Aldrovandia affinis]|uniref:Uncharacterized protein n=1 Tax=Aldrovandia affinis TaxID=143900 RepID=A0AAD7SKG1_9TELE|nr:hypothetical protein AAFF_G00342880 [Aldrovandia affinis]